MTNDFSDNLGEELSAYLDGELDAARRADVEVRLLRDPAARAELDRLRETVAMVGNLDRRRPPARMADNIMNAVERLNTQPSPAVAPMVRFPWRVVRAVMLSAAMIAIVVSAGIWVPALMPNRAPADRFASVESKVEESQAPMPARSEGVLSEPRPSGSGSSAARPLSKDVPSTPVIAALKSESDERLRDDADDAMIPVLEVRYADADGLRRGVARLNDFLEWPRPSPTSDPGAADKSVAGLASAMSKEEPAQSSFEQRVDVSLLDVQPLLSLFADGHFVLAPARAHTPQDSLNEQVRRMLTALSHSNQSQVAAESSSADSFDSRTTYAVERRQAKGRMAESEGAAQTAVAGVPPTANVHDGGARLTLIIRFVVSSGDVAEPVAGPAKDEEHP